MKEQINNILKAVGLKAVEVKLAQMVLQDGVTTIEAESFEAGMSVAIVTDGGTVALPVGEYTLEDGRILIVEQEGIIAEIKEAEAPEQEVEVEIEAPEAVPTEMEQTAPKKTVESVVKETYFSAEEVETLKAEIESLKSQVQELKEQKPVELSTESDEPAAAPIVHNPENETKSEGFTWGAKGAPSIKQSVYSFLNK